MGAQQAKDDELRRAREVLAYALKEVSVVDRPANERPFAILKSKTTEDHMSGAFITEDQVLNTLSDDTLDGAEAVNKNDSGKPEADAGTDTGQGDADPEPDPKGGEQVAKGDEGDPDPETSPIEEFATWLKEAAKADGAPREAISQVAKILTGMKTGNPETAPAAEGDPEPADVPSVQVFDDGRVIVAGNVVNKSRRFTQSRTKQIAETVASMVKLLQEVDEEAFKGLVASFTKTTKAEGDTTPAEPAAGEPKSDDAIAKLTEKVDGIAKKLDDVESARAPSKASDGDDTAGADPVKKNDEGGLWSGVLWSEK